MPISKPNLTRVWADAAGAGNVVDPGDPKFSQGWLAEIPTFQNFNALQQIFTQGLAHFNENGIGVWDTDTVYPALFGLAKGATNGFIYQAILQQNGNNPETDNGTNWILWHTDYVDMRKTRLNLFDNPGFSEWQRGNSFNLTDVAITADRWFARGATLVGGSVNIDKLTTSTAGDYMLIGMTGNTNHFYITQRLDIYQYGVNYFSNKEFTFTVQTKNDVAADWYVAISIVGASTIHNPPLDDHGHGINLELAAQNIPAGDRITSFTFTMPDYSSEILDEDSYLSVSINSAVTLPDGFYRFLNAQLERGGTFVGFEDESTGVIRARTRYVTQSYPSSSTEKQFAWGRERVNNQVEFIIPTSQQMRQPPTINFGDFSLRARGDGDSQALSNFVVQNVETAGVRVWADVTGGLSLNQAYCITIQNPGILILDSEL